jgi:hypothetical protein
VILAIAVFFFFRSSTIYSTQVQAVKAGSTIGIAPFTDRVDFGEVPQGDVARFLEEFNTRKTVARR